jgi:hypothetical protein
MYQNVFNEIKVLAIKNNLAADQDNKSNSLISYLLNFLHSYTIFALELDLKEFIKKRNH